MAMMIDSLHTAVLLSVLVSLQLRLYFPYTLIHSICIKMTQWHFMGYDDKSLHAMEDITDGFFSSFARNKGTLAMVNVNQTSWICPDIILHRHMYSIHCIRVNKHFIYAILWHKMIALNSRSTLGLLQSSSFIYRRYNPHHQVDSFM